MPKILVVDDSATMRKIIMKALGQAGFKSLEFVEAGSGTTALEILSEEQVDLILSDVNMPDMNGIELVQAIREQTTTQTSTFREVQLVKKVGNNVPIVMVTTEGGAQSMQEALEAGANDYLQKPFTPDDLAEKVRPFLS